MLIWALFAAMTAAAALIVLVPLARRDAADAAPTTGGGDVSVYRDQLAEIDRDLDDGLVAPSEAEAARAEIGRRILRATRRDDTAAATRPTTLRSRVVAIVAVVLVPTVALVTYGALGRPDLGDMPLSSRKAAAPEGQSIEDLVTRVEAHLAQNPTDVRGWEVVAPVYMRLGRMDAAADAWKTAVRLGGPSEKRMNGLGEALTVAASGIVTAEARTAFQKSLELEPRGVLPRMYLALALSQDGKAKESADAWRDLVQAAAGDEAWLDTAKEELAKAEAAASGKPVVAPPPAAAAPSPSASDIDAAAKMSPEDRSKMIEGMVARLAERLAASGGTLEEWERLIRSQAMLGRTADARASLDRAKAALATNAAATARLDALAAELKP